MERLKPRIVVGAHYGIGDASDIDACRGYLTSLRTRSAELKKDGNSTAEAGKLLVEESRRSIPAGRSPRGCRPGRPRSTGNCVVRGPD
jgi:hypothetical protein